MRWGTRKYTLEQEIRLPRRIVWELLSDTDKLNRIIGLLPVQFSPAISSQTAFYREASATFAGMVSLRWKEYPFDWIKNESYSVRREYVSGPLSLFVGGVELSDAETAQPDGSSATVVRLFAEFTPSNAAGLVAIPLIGLRSMKNTLKYLVDEVHSQHKHTFQSRTIVKPLVNQTLWTELEKELEQKPILSHFLPYLRKQIFTLGDEEVVNMRPYQLAEKWGLIGDEVLRLFLYATKAGMLTLSWNLMCPNCKVSKAAYSTLSDLKGQFHCDLCKIDFSTDFDRHVELCFSVHPALRKAQHLTYCIGGPMLTPHIFAQKRIPAGARSILPSPPLPDGFRIRVLKVNHTIHVTANSGLKLVSPVSLCYFEEGWKEDSVEIPDDPPEVEIVNQSPEDIVIAVESLLGVRKAVTAAKVSTMQEFRDLFSSEVLAPGQQVGIENITIFFSDLRGSTSLYERIGDAVAFGKVRNHFDFLTQWIAKNAGCVVKTIGDAVMAVFYSPEEAVQAALDIQTHVRGFNASQENEFVLKIGLHTGPAIVINSNDKLDYFGRTVNIAARIQSESVGGDLVISKACFDRGGVQKIIEQSPMKITSFHTPLRGMDGEIELLRINQPDG